MIDMEGMGMRDELENDGDLGPALIIIIAIVWTLVIMIAMAVSNQ
jgi:hypothetical protein